MVGTSLKAYFDQRRFDDWVAEVARRATDEQWSSEVDVFVLPDYLSIPIAVGALAGSGVAVGGQDVSERGYGSTTGDVPAARLARAGCTMVCVGHAERRALHGETDATVTAKVGQVVLAGMTPLVCIGEQSPDATSAVGTCAAQLESALVQCDAEQHVIVAYEPVWAIGAEQPAGADYVREVVGGLRDRFSGRPGLRFLYGGSAKPGLLSSVADVVDGLFLGRFAHDPAAFSAVVAEARSRRAPTKPS